MLLFYFQIYIYLNAFPGQQQIIKILPNSSGQQLKAISKHALRTADATKVVAQVIESHTIIYWKKYKMFCKYFRMHPIISMSSSNIEIKYVLFQQRSMGISSTSQSSGANRIVSSTPTRTGIKVTSQQMVSTNVMLFHPL